jgi:hypothetical protein
MVFSVQENGEKKEVYLLSSSPTEIKPPAIKIKSVKQLLNELRYHFKIMFASGEIAFIEECVYSSLLLQNENAVDFVAEKVEEFDIEEDLVVSLSLRKNRHQETTIGVVFNLITNRILMFQTRTLIT